MKCKEYLFNIIAYFDNGVDGEYITILPLSDNSIEIIENYNFQLDYIEIDSVGYEELTNYLNEEHDLMELNKFAKQVLHWDINDYKKFIKNNLGGEVSNEM